MNDEFEPIDKLDEICALLDELEVKYEVHYQDEGEFSFLADGEVSIKVPDPYIERIMFIDLQGEFSLYFGEEWHDHYYCDNEGFQDLCDTIKGIINNEMCSSAVFYGEDLQWGGSWLSVKDDKIRECCSGYYINTMSNHINEYKKDWESKKMYSELRFKFWDPKYDRIVTVEKGS